MNILGTTLGWGVKSAWKGAFLVLGVLSLAGIEARAQVYEKVYSFTDANAALPNPAGSEPEGIILGRDGKIYGTTYAGGAGNSGTIFKMTPLGGLKVLVAFTGNGTSNRGAGPTGQLVQSGDGNFYGTTAFGGLHSNGTIFKMTDAGVLTTLVDFDGTVNGSGPQGLVLGNDGNFYGCAGTTAFKMTPTGTLTKLSSSLSGSSYGSLVQGSDGKFYGTTQTGGTGNQGTVFSMTSTGTLTTLVNFGSSDGTAGIGTDPEAGLTQASDGNFYGTTFTSSSPDGFGTIFKMTPTGTLTPLVLQGHLSNAPLIDGSFYGTTSDGGAYNHGTVFKLGTDATVSTLIDFTGNGASNRGSNPDYLIAGKDGNFYGTTINGGSNSDGTIFRMTPAGVLTTLFDFAGLNTAAAGAVPNNLIQGSDGNLYGTTQSGGPYNVAAVPPGYGTVFKMTPAGEVSTLVNFTDTGATNPGSMPAGLVLATDGNFYGATERGGVHGAGIAFKMTLNGALTKLVDFSGQGPKAPLVQGTDGNFYGTTFGGGLSSFGTVFTMTPTGSLTILGNFDNSDNGGLPAGSLLQGQDGNFYGTTTIGGANGSDASGVSPK